MHTTGRVRCYSGDQNELTQAEDKLNEVMAEMNSYSPPKAAQYGDYSYADFTDEEKGAVAAAHEAFGVELTDELIAEYDSQPDPFSLTEAELAEVRT